MGIDERLRGIHRMMTEREEERETQRIQDEKKKEAVSKYVGMFWKAFLGVISAILIYALTS